MVRLFYIVGIASLLASCGVFGLCVRQWYRVDPQRETLLQAPGAVQRYAENAGKRALEGEERVSPLVAQAELFASYLNPPRLVDEKTQETPPVVEGKWEPPVSVPPVRPAAASAKFTLLATSFCPSQPGRSMALISEVGSLEGNERWVKEGAQVGHFVIHEIRRGAIVYREGDQLREMTVDVAAAPRSLVRDIRPGSRTASAAIEGLGVVAPTSAGPNIVTLIGN